MQKYIFLLLSITSLFSGFHSKAQNYLVNGGALSFGQSDANTCLSDAWSAFNNIAGIAGQKSILFAASTKKYYDGIDLRDHYFAVIYPLENFSISVGIISHGNEYFNQQKLGFGIANKVGFVKLGIQVGYFQTRAEGLGSDGNLVIDFGGIAEISDKISFGAHIFNFTQSSLKSSITETIPIIMKAGLMYSPSENFQSFMDIEKEISSEPLYKIGLKYEIVTSLFIQTGITINPTKNFFGLNYDGKKFDFGYAFAFHQTLGMVHQASLGLKLKKK